MTTNAYTFLPWLRSGLTTRIEADPGAAARASIDVDLLITGVPVSGRDPLTRTVPQPIQLYGPGDVVGVDARAIARVEPRAGITNFEPNFLAHIEFADEDFPWRYSPAVQDSGHRLAPWLALAVLAAGDDPAGGDAEFTEAAQGSGPLPAISVRDVTTLPRPDQLGAWAHVHVNGALDSPVATDSTDVALAALAGVLRTDADSACARLICPRRLEPDTAYVAFLVPAFETGRLAGLGFDPALSPGSLYSSWGPHYANRRAEGELPYYYRWAFRTGTAGDFELLVRLLRPQAADPRVGRRDIDVHNTPGLGLPGITTPAELGGILRLGGALRVPPAPEDPPFDLPENWDNWHQDPSLPAYPHPFEQALAGVINLAEDYRTDGTPGGADPLITPPLYGRWHALTSRLQTGSDAPDVRNWVHRLNFDPRFRVAANLGTRVVQARQEELMAAAWRQVGDVLAVNTKIRAAQAAREVGHALQTRHIDPPTGTTLAALAAAPTGRALTLTAPAHPRVIADDPSADTPAKVALGFRVARSQVAAAPVSPEMRRIARPGARLMRSLSPPGGTFTVNGLLPRMDAPTDAVTAAPPKGTPGGLVTDEQVERALHPGVDPDADPVDRLPHSPDFVLSDPGEPAATTVGTTDSAEATRFKGALHELYQGLASAVAVARTATARPRLLVAEATDAALTGLRADDTVPKNLFDSVGVPDRLRPFAEQFVEAMAYPVFDLPTYQPLLDQGVDAFVPNLSLVPGNSVTLLANNREFIEAYLVGLNHEMGRELLWREYPTDQRGTPFRQFWDPRATLPLPDETPAQLRERTYDIPPIHTWPRSGFLGQNGNRLTDDLVLVIRGELLKKYPTAAVYAQRAEWPPGPDGPDTTQQRRPVTLPDGVVPGHDVVRLPLYEAKIEPDIYLLGFDLDADEARGNPPDDPGWFFMIKERPGDPRFGVDDGTPTNLEVWNDLTWNDVDPHHLGFLELDPTVSVGLQPLDNVDDNEKKDQRAEDVNLPLWFAGLSSADLAYLLFQVPVLVAVHAQEMLPR
ncbi:hypothetical protein [Actinoplanes sp. NPDC051411]|uniref:hypothetical protein n=1 Tax=Actinoplanes sp. NPDC051411 TaxID=3155522 RepID=UPI0034451435